MQIQQELKKIVWPMSSYRQTLNHLLGALNQVLSGNRVADSVGMSVKAAAEAYRTQLIADEKQAAATFGADSLARAMGVEEMQRQRGRDKQLRYDDDTVAFESGQLSVRRAFVHLQQAIAVAHVAGGSGVEHAASESEKLLNDFLRNPRAPGVQAVLAERMGDMSTRIEAVAAAITKFNLCLPGRHAPTAAPVASAPLQYGLCRNFGTRRLEHGYVGDTVFFDDRALPIAQIQGCALALERLRERLKTVSFTVDTNFQACWFLDDLEDIDVAIRTHCTAKLTDAQLPDTMSPADKLLETRQLDICGLKVAEFLRTHRKEIKVLLRQYHKVCKQLTAVTANTLLALPQTLQFVQMSPGCERAMAAVFGQACKDMGVVASSLARFVQTLPVFKVLALTHIVLVIYDIVSAVMTAETSVGRFSADLQEAGEALCSAFQTNYAMPPADECAAGIRRVLSAHIPKTVYVAAVTIAPCVTLYKRLTATLLLCGSQSFDVIVNLLASPTSLLWAAKTAVMSLFDVVPYLKDFVETVGITTTVHYALIRVFANAAKLVAAPQLVESSVFVAKKTLNIALLVASAWRMCVVDRVFYMQRDGVVLPALLPWVFVLGYSRYIGAAFGRNSAWHLLLPMLMTVYMGVLVHDVMFAPESSVVRAFGWSVDGTVTDRLQRYFDPTKPPMTRLPLPQDVIATLTKAGLYGAQRRSTIAETAYSHTSAALEKVLETVGSAAAAAIDNPITRASIGMTLQGGSDIFVAAAVKLFPPIFYALLSLFTAVFNTWLASAR